MSRNDFRRLWCFLPPHFLCSDNANEFLCRDIFQPVTPLCGSHVLCHLQSYIPKSLGFRAWQNHKWFCHVQAVFFWMCRKTKTHRLIQFLLKANGLKPLRSDQKPRKNVYSQLIEFRGQRESLILSAIPSCTKISFRLSLLLSFKIKLKSLANHPHWAKFVSGIGKEIILLPISSGRMIDGNPPYELSKPFLLKTIFIPFHLFRNHTHRLTMYSIAQNVYHRWYWIKNFQIFRKICLCTSMKI